MLRKSDGSLIAINTLKLTRFTANDFNKALDKAESEFGNIFTRTVKSAWRRPQDISDSDVFIKLYVLLNNSSGDTGKKSYKYLTLSKLFNVTADSDEDARNFVQHINERLSNANARYRDYINAKQLPIYLPDVMFYIEELNADPDIRNNDGMAILHMLAHSRLLAIKHPLNPSKFVKFPEFKATLDKLISKYGADIHLKINSRYPEKNLTAIEYLLNHHPTDPAAIMELVRHGANPFATDRQGNTILHMLARELASATDPELIAVYKADMQEMIEEYSLKIDSTNNHGHTPLFHMVYQKNKPSLSDTMLDAIEYIASLGGNLNLNYFEHEPIIHLIINRILEKTAIPEQNNDDIEIIKRYKQALTQLIKHGAFVHTKNTKNKTLLESTLNYGIISPDVVFMLLDLGAKKDSMDQYGRPILHLFLRGFPIILKILIEEYELNIHVKNQKGETAIEHLLNSPKKFNTEDIMQLVELGADINSTNKQSIPLILLLMTNEDNSAAIRKLLPKVKLTRTIMDLFDAMDKTNIHPKNLEVFELRKKEKKSHDNVEMGPVAYGQFKNIVLHSPPKPIPQSKQAEPNKKYSYSPTGNS